MRNVRRNIAASGILALASRASAQVASVCPSTDVCFQLNIPETTASSGNGDIFFQIAAPSNYEWVALGQGNRMSGSNMFVVYTSVDGNNVTLSPRTVSGYSMPTFNSDAQVTLLEGSGVSNGRMVANVRCSNCNSWSGGSADFTENNGNWIYGYQSSGGPKNSDDTNDSISQHNGQASFQWDYANAKGGSSVNPLLNSGTAGTGSGSPGATSCVPRPQNSGGSATTGAGSATPTSGDDDDRWGRTKSWNTAWGPSPTAKPSGRPWGPPGDDSDATKRNEKRQEVNYCDDNSNSGLTIISPAQTSEDRMLIAHAVLACLAFVFFFPTGSILIRVASFPGVLWLHAAFQVFGYIVFIAGFGLGVYYAVFDGYLQENHPIIGMVVFAVLFFQPILGFLHHLGFKKSGMRTIWSHLHLWVGRLAITLGIINGGLGFKLTGNTGGGMIAYSVFAGIMWLLWVAAAVYGERKRSRAQAVAATHPPKYTETSPAHSTDGEREMNDIPHPPQGHYAPK